MRITYMVNHVLDNLSMTNLNTKDYDAAQETKVNGI